MSDELYSQIVLITEEYLGPAARRFVARQISSHLHKTPSEITRADLPKLVEWTRVTLGLLTDDRTVVEEYTQKIIALQHLVRHE
jgi:cobalamin biosynthesis protein CbiG